MFKNNMNQNEVLKLLKNNKNGFLKELNNLICSTDKEINNIKDFYDTDLKVYFDFSYTVLSRLLNSYNIIWNGTFKKFGFFVFEVPEDEETIIKEKEDKLYIAKKDYSNIKQYQIRFDENIKNELDTLILENKNLDKTYIISRVIEFGVNQLKEI